MIYVCPNCTYPTYVDKTKVEYKQYPGVAYGNKVKHVPENIDTLYEESRNCMSVKSFTASVMASRKLLMSIAVDKGAEEGLNFIEYVDYLDDNRI
jgi:predicted urease superfamily metal-dependent hydrolase